MGSRTHELLEFTGREELKYCCFAIVGGGMGERLHSPHPKLCLTSNLVSNQSFLGLYFSYFKAIEEIFDCKVPVVIMTSSATHQSYVSNKSFNHYIIRSLHLIRNHV